MAKLSNISASAKTKEGPVFICADVKVSSRGLFTATVGTKELMKFKDFLPDLPKENAKFTITAEKYDDLQPKLRQFLEETVSCELVESKEVIRYNIETRCQYVESDDEDGNQIYPNGKWLPKRLNKIIEAQGCIFWRQGTEKIREGWPEPFGLKIYCQVFRKNTYRYKNGRETMQYERVSSFNMGENKYDNLCFLKSLVGMGIDEHKKAQEIEATEENAAVFVQLIKFICKANKIMKALAEPELLEEFIKVNQNKQITL